VLDAETLQTFPSEDSAVLAMKPLAVLEPLRGALQLVREARKAPRILADLRLIGLLALLLQLVGFRSSSMICSIISL
jgi:hypothetical protein